MKARLIATLIWLALFCGLVLGCAPRLDPHPSPTAVQTYEKCRKDWFVIDNATAGAMCGRNPVTGRYGGS